MSKNIKLKRFTDDEYTEVMNFMASNRKDHNSKVGLFWYDEINDKLFGMVKSDPKELKVNSSGGRISCRELHEDIWKYGVRDRKYNKTTDPFIGQYQDTPRGRIFYNPRLDSYEVCVGKWINSYPEAYDLILIEFNLPEDSTELVIAKHWDLGQTWN